MLSRLPEGAILRVTEISGSDLGHAGSELGLYGYCDFGVMFRCRNKSVCATEIMCCIMYILLGIHGCCTIYSISIIFSIGYNLCLIKVSGI